MQFSLAKFIVLVTFANIILALSFAVPFPVGFYILTVISLIILPPFVIVGAVNNRGPRQAFFLGCLLAGTTHFICSIIFGFLIIQAEWSDSLDASDGVQFYQYFHLVGYCLGILGGFSGVAAYFIVVDQPSGTTKPEMSKERASEEVDPILSVDGQVFDQDQDTGSKDRVVPR